jgi:hypothetical protein
LDEIGFAQKEATPIYVDNLSAIILSDTYKINQKSGHMTMKINFIHEQIKAKTIKVQFITSEEQVADILTKPLPKLSFSKHSDKLLRGFDGQRVATNKGKKTVTFA